MVLMPARHPKRHRRARGKIVPDAEQGCSRAGILLANGARTPARAERWGWGLAHTGILPMGRHLSAVATIGGGE
jgi:hypothetical protein